MHTDVQCSFHHWQFSISPNTWFLSVWSVLCLLVALPKTLLLFCISSFLFTSFAVHPPAQMKSRSHLVTAGFMVRFPCVSCPHVKSVLQHEPGSLRPAPCTTASPPSKCEEVKKWQTGTTLDISALNAARFNADKCNKGNRRSPKQSCM